jgi:hypothetical protein
LLPNRISVDDLALLAFGGLDELERRRRMSEPSVMEVEVATAVVQELSASGYNNEDDDDDADYDDDDSPSISRHDRWFSRLGFGSPEWWSQI